MAETLFAWEMTKTDGEFSLKEKPFPKLEEGEALVRVAGCGVCHTDLSFWHYGVKTRHELPLTLGHEISGVVIEGPENWIGKKVVIPAVLPCGECDLCASGRSNICQNQLMPGNDFDGGFASHIKVPARYLCEVPEKLLEKYRLSELAVVADAVSTPYQVVQKSEMLPGDFVIAIGAGGIGLYGIQIAKAFGGKVLAIDISEAKLAEAQAVGADAILNSKGLDIKDIKNSVRQIAKELGAPRNGWKILEMSGTAAGQELAFALITYASTMSVVGFTMDKLNVRLSNLMAFDAKIIGTWGCKAELYPEILNWVAEGKISIKPLIAEFPLSKINEVFRDSLDHKHDKRPILVPDFN